MLRSALLLIPGRSRLRQTIGRLGCRSLLPAVLLLGSSAFLPRADAIVTFVFVYADKDGKGFNDPAHPEYKQGLETAGNIMGGFFTNSAAVTLKVVSINDPKSSTLASASSPSFPSGPGFYPTVVQAKVLSNGANDLNGDEPDGDVEVNLGSSYQYDPTAAIGAGQIDFVGTMIHELTHAFGFASQLAQTPTAQPQILTTFDSFLSNSAGESLFRKEMFIFKETSLATLTGGNNTLMATPSPTGEYFNGPYAVAAFGGPVPLFSPSPYQSGSSGSHLDDNTQSLHSNLMAANAEAPNAEKAMMGVTMARAYSAVEKGIMTDLGYALNP